MTERPFLTRHARTRAREMGVSRGEIVEALRNYELRYPSPSHHGPNRFVTVSGRLAIVHTPGMAIITILWQGREGRDLAA